MKLLALSAERLRLFPALVMTLSGMGQVAALWLRELNHQAVLDALSGVIYLFIAIGLYGSSRFTLFVAIGFPLATGLYAAAYYSPNAWLTLRLALDALTITGAGLVLLHRDTFKTG